MQGERLRNVGRILVKLTNPFRKMLGVLGHHVKLAKPLLLFEVFEDLET